MKPTFDPERRIEDWPDSGGPASDLGQEPFQKESTTLLERAKDLASTVGEQAKNAASAVADKAHDVTSTVKTKAGEMATTLERGASEAATAAADTFEAGRAYVAQGTAGMARDVTNVIRRNPFPALLIGFGLGFMIARATRR
jgi:ElaB/YqjD/DUF883 family membrane-anchored ribosome-binding protein